MTESATMQRSKSISEAAANRAREKMMEKAVKLRQAEARSKAEARRSQHDKVIAKLEESKLAAIPAPKRDSAGIKAMFLKQHWWKGEVYAAKGNIDEEKAAMIYEAMRRRPEIQTAWMKIESKAQSDQKELQRIRASWQPFTHFVLEHFEQSWVELNKTISFKKDGKVVEEYVDSNFQKLLIDEIASPYFVPPEGLSTYPDAPDIPKEKRENGYVTTKQRREQIAMQILGSPKEVNVDEEALLLQVRRLAAAGFIIVAIDNKTQQSFDDGYRALYKLKDGERSARKVDLVHRFVPSPNAKDGKARRDEIEARKEKAVEDWRVAREKVERGEKSEPILLKNEWQTLGDITTKANHKRQTKGGQKEEHPFNFSQICTELKVLDQKGVNSSFVDSLRLDRSE